jgi:heterodisulfide reductase subunit D
MSSTNNLKGEFRDWAIQYLKICTYCNLCRDECPSYDQELREAYATSGRLRSIRTYLEQHYSVDEPLVNSIYSCTTCGACDTHCPVGINPVEIIERLRNNLIQKGLVKNNKALSLAINTHLENNPYGDARAERLAWFEKAKEHDRELANFKIPDTGEIGFFVGCTASYRENEAAIHTLKALNKMHPEGIVLLGDDEICCGSPLLRSGLNDFDIDLPDGTKAHFSLKSMIQQNIEAFQQRGVKKLIFACSGCYRTVLQDWPQLIHDQVPFEAYHFSQYLPEFLKSGKIQLKAWPVRITYHDPCHLGRHAHEYEAPRNLLKAIPEIDFVEMEYNRAESHCCGAGGGVKANFPESALEIAKKRIKEAEQTRASVLATACVFCKRNLTDARNALNSKLDIMDIEDILIRVMQ